MLFVFFFVPHPQHIFTSLFLKVAASEIYSKSKYVGKYYKGGVKLDIAMLFPSAPSKWNKERNLFSYLLGILLIKHLASVFLYDFLG